jgi:hypothetical protein
LDRFCANEADYHQRVIRHMATFPDLLKARPGLETFVWGHEIDLHDAGRGGGNGCADLFTVDEEGMVWLVEVKFDKTSERGQFVWESQLARYRSAIHKMEWHDVLSYVRKFLRWGEKTKPNFEIPASTQTFVQVLELWQAILGRALVTADELNNRVAAHLKYGTYGIMVLTDIDDHSYEHFGTEFKHGGPLAYVQGIPTQDGMNYSVKWYKPGKADTNPVLRRETWTSVLGPLPKLTCEPESFADSLSSGSRKLWIETLRPGLAKLNWDPGKISSMGFEACFKVNNTSTPLLLIGWPERDDKDVSREEKMYGTAAMRVDVHVKRMYEASGMDVILTNKLMEEFHLLGWKGRASQGMRERWGVTPIAAEEFRSKAQGIMRYQPRRNVSCHTGRDGDVESLDGLLRDLAKFLEKVRYAGT